MTLLHMDGFDLGDAGLRSSYYRAGNANQSSTTCFSYGSSCAANTIVRQPITASAHVYQGCRINNSGQEAALSFWSDSGTTQHITVQVSTDGTIRIRRGAIANGTVLATSAAGVALGWYYMEVDCTISDTVGAVNIRLNGSTSAVLTFSGDTKNGGTSTNIDAVALDAYGGNALFDDWYVTNDQGSLNVGFLGDVRVYTLAPTGAGNYTQFTPSTGANYACVDEQPYSTTDYVGSPTSGNRDSYALTDLPASVTTVFGTQELAIAVKNDAGLQSIKTTVRVNSTDYESSATVLGTSYVSMSNIREQNPNTSAAWTPSGVNGTEIGVRVG